MSYLGLPIWPGMSEMRHVCADIAEGVRHEYALLFHTIWINDGGEERIGNFVNNVLVTVCRRLGDLLRKKRFVVTITSGQDVSVIF